MIDMENVVKRYTLGGETIYALDHVSLHVSPGEYVAIIGPSGSGKSTLMNIIGCLDQADGGTYLLNGKPIKKYRERQLARIRSQQIGFIFQGFNLLPKLSAFENVELPLIYQGVSARKRRKRVREALERVGLGQRMKHRPNQLSGGQQQRCAIARALAVQPSLILADEPTGNLDKKTGREIMQVFDELHKAGNTIVLITHDDKVAQCAQRIIRIEDGKLYENQEVPDDDAVPVV
ncbi:MAG: ABC transporter ATP-binding protein [Clostridia bacterium]|nr:ABC transporter ATP-binding protein [Clostridia bacterium]